MYKFFSYYLLNKPLQVFVFLLFFASLFRLPNLNNLPSGFFGDEAALAYNSWSILKTGKDEWGKLLPLTMRSFDDYKPALYSYLTIPSVALLGLTHQAARLPAAISGSILPGLLFLFLYKKKDIRITSIGFLSSIVLILTPWHWEISRTAIEAGVAVTLTLLLIYLLRLKHTTKTSKARLIVHLVTTFILGISILFTYHTARLILPILLISGLALNQLNKSKSTFFLTALLTFLGFGLAITASSQRYSQISLFSDPGVAAMRTENIFRSGMADLPPMETRIYHNKPLSWFQSFLSNYLSNTSLSYLFLSGAQPQRASIPETGQFLWIFLPFFLIGLFASARHMTKLEIWIIFWLIVAPLPASLTTAELPHTYRTLFMIVPISILIATGIYTSFDTFYFWTNKKIKKIAKPAFLLMLATILLLTTANTGKAWHQFSIQQGLNQPWYRQYGYKELYEYLNSFPKEELDTVTITNRQMEPYIFYLFYNKIDPAVYQKLPNKRLAHQDISYNNKREWQLFNFIFSEEPCPYQDNDLNPKNLYIVNQNCETPANYERVRNINFKDGVPMFHVDRPKVTQKKD